MEGGEDQLIFCGDGDDFRHQIEQQQHEVSALQEGQLPLQLPAMDASSHCEDSNGEGMLEGSPETNDPGLSFPTSGRGGGVASASVPGPSRSGGEIMQEVSENMVVATVGDAAEVDVEDTDRTAMVLGDSDVASMTVDDAASVPAKRKRGRPPKNPGERTAPVKKKERDDVCFVCFDRTNPNLVFCNRRACYKAYHPACVNREEAFFRGKGKWNCGWHICSICQKTAYHMCYMCTTSYCKVCINQENKYVSLRGTHGFCQSCHNTVKLIEENKLACEEKNGVSFDDTDSFTVLFKAYWLDLKGKLSMTSIELSNARHPCAVTQNEESSDELYDANKDQDISSESSSGHEGNISLKKKLRRPSQAFTAGESLACEIDGGVSMFKETEWASKELLELVAHMRSGDQSFISQFEVQAILLEYIKKYNLRDPRRKSQIVCDMRLRNLFGKERVGHFEMLKLLELHFVKKEASQVVASDNQVESVKSDYKHIDAFEEGETIARLGSEKQRKSHKRTEREQLSNLDDYAAVDVHNITQIFLRRSLVEELLDDIETFNDKVVGSFVRIRIPNSGQRQDLYRLVQVVGIQESTKPYKVGKKTTDLVLEILNLDKKETSTIDSISNQDFTEEECQRLRQSIKCGLIDRLKVGDIQEKAKILQTVRVNDLLEHEKLRISHLRDRASETGRRKELRECVEKLQILNSPEERRRRLCEVPEIHADPKMNPEYESSEGEEYESNEDNKSRPTESLHLRKQRELIPRGRAGRNLGNSGNGMRRNPNSPWEPNRQIQGEVGQDKFDMLSSFSVRGANEISENQSKEINQIQGNFTRPRASSQENYPSKSSGHPSSSLPESNSATPAGPLPLIPNDCDKIWHYQDPSNNFQGPFSLIQLRKWNATGYFPPDLRIWRTSEKQGDALLLTDVLGGNYSKNTPQNLPQQRTWTQSHQNGGSLNAIKNTALPVSRLPSESPVQTYGNPYHTPSYPKKENVGGDFRWNQDHDNGNIWSPTRPEDRSCVPVVVGSLSANELNDGSNRYQAFESDCPSPTPRILRNKSSHLHHGAKDSGDKAPSNEMQKLANSKSNLSVISATSADNMYPASGTGLAQRAEFPLIHNSLIRPSGYRLEHDQAQNHKLNLSPIHQGNLQNAGGFESALPSPTPRSHTYQTGLGSKQPDSSSPACGVPSQTQKASPKKAEDTANPSWGWAKPGWPNSSPNFSWGTPQANANPNAAWAAQPQGNNWEANLNSNANIPGWGNVSWGMGLKPNPMAAGWGSINPGDAVDNKSRNMSWTSLDRDTSRHDDYERRNGGRYSAGYRGRDGGGSDPRNNSRIRSGGKGVCKFYESGHCKKGNSCKYLHA